MKNILLIRHAKSSWSDFSVADFDRPLNERGTRDAPMMAERLIKRGVVLDAIVSSPALRAITTARYFHSAYGGKIPLIELPGLYHAHANQFFDVIHQLSADFQQVAIFSHNQGITDAANLMGVAKIDSMPTCAVFAVRSQANTWSSFHKEKKELWFFDYPKLVT